METPAVPSDLWTLTLSEDGESLIVDCVRCGEIGLVSAGLSEYAEAADMLAEHMVSSPRCVNALTSRDLRFTEWINAVLSTSRVNKTEDEGSQ